MLRSIFYAYLSQLSVCVLYAFQSQWRCVLYCMKNSSKSHCITLYHVPTLNKWSCMKICHICRKLRSPSPHLSLFYWLQLNIWEGRRLSMVKLTALVLLKWKRSLKNGVIRKATHWPCNFQLILGEMKMHPQPLHCSLVRGLESGLTS